VKVKDCTKEELLYIIERLSWLSDYHLNLILNEIEYNREKKRIEEAQKFADIAYKKRNEALEILKPYVVKPLKDVPAAISKKADALLAEATAAERRWAKLSDIKL
jgi:hypothetical protein